MSSLKSRIRNIETGLDVSRLSREQIRMLDISRLTREQKESLDGEHLTDEQIYSIGIDNLTDAQLTAIIKDSDEKYPELQAVIHSMSNEELTAVKEGRLNIWYPGYIHDSTE
jgi:hypothetical protein